MHYNYAMQTSRENDAWLKDLHSKGEEKEGQIIAPKKKAVEERIRQMKLSVVDVKCRDERGDYYVVEMQVLNVEAFEKRVVLNAAKACTMQLEARCRGSTGLAITLLNERHGITRHCVNSRSSLSSDSR